MKTKKELKEQSKMKNNGIVQLYSARLLEFDSERFLKELKNNAIIFKENETLKIFYFKIGQADIFINVENNKVSQIWVEGARE